MNMLLAKDILHDLLESRDSRGASDDFDRKNLTQLDVVVFLDDLCEILNCCPDCSKDVTAKLLKFFSALDERGDSFVQSYLLQELRRSFSSCKHSMLMGRSIAFALICFLSFSHSVSRRNSGRAWPVISDLVDS